jgi:hypothetical protein
MWFVVSMFIQGMEYLFAVFFWRKGIVLSFVLSEGPLRGLKRKEPKQKSRLKKNMGKTAVE